MDLYIIRKEGRPDRFAGTQADARTTAKATGGTWEAITVPDRKEDRLAWLNSYAATAFDRTRHVVGIARMEIVPTAAELLDDTVERTMTATAVLSRVDNPGTDVDRIVETISKAKGYALKRYAAAVAQAFQALAHQGKGEHLVDPPTSLTEHH